MKNITKAILLSAGLGTRLRPITLQIPKCMVTIAGLPLLEHWIRHLENLKVDSVIINTHYLAEQVENYINQRQNNLLSINIINEKELLGTAGTLIANKDFFKDSIGILIHADNYTKTNLNELIKAFHNRPSGCLLTMLTFNSPNPESCGVVEISEKGIVTNFHEKVKYPPSNRANGAIYIFGQEFLDWLSQYANNCSDFSTEILPKLIGRISTWHTLDPYIDIGTPSALAKARAL